MYPNTMTHVYTDGSAPNALEQAGYGLTIQCLSQDLDFFHKNELLKFFRELFAKERSYPSTAKMWRMYIKCAYYMPEHVAIV